RPRPGGPACRGRALLCRTGCGRHPFVYPDDSLSL
ncbi:uncharacterized protein METZ01_LOCUS450824, partial [marine metagenome]